MPKSMKSRAARASLSRLSFARKPAGVIISKDARKIIDPRSISLRAIKELRDKVLSGEAANGVDLYVAKRDLSDKVQEGATIQVLRTKPDGKLQGRVAYVDVPITFEPGKDADPKLRQDWTTEDVAEHVVLALTKNLTQAQFYLSLLEQEDIGAAFQGTFVIQARKCRFQDLVAALEDHFGQDADTTFVWLDLFCANQPLLISADEALSPDVILARNQYLTHGLHRAIGRFGSAVIFFDRWDVPAPLQRAWCVWEIMGAITQAQSLQVVFAPGQEQAFIEVLLKDVEGLAKILAENDNMRDAKCWKKEEKEIIDKAIEATVKGGYVTLIEEVNQRVHAWRLQIARDAALDARRGGGDPSKLADILRCTGVLLSHQGNYIGALQMLEEALSIYKEVNGARHSLVGTTLDNIARIYDSQGRHDEALAYYEEALSIRKEALGDRHPDVATTLNIIASVCASQGRYEEALAYCEKALSIRKEALGDRHPDVATTLNNIAFVYYSQDLYEEALAYYEEDLSISKEALGDRHPSVATTLNNIASVYSSQGRCEDALAYYEKALSIFKEALGNRHPDVSTTLNNIAGAYDAQGRYEEALTYYEEALSIFEEALGDRHPDVSTTLGDIASVYASQGRYEEALAHYESALSISKESFGDRHPNVATILNNIACVYDLQGRDEEALAYYEEALSIFKEALGDRHPSVATLLNNMRFTRERMQARRKRKSPLRKLACLWGEQK